MLLCNIIYNCILLVTCMTIYESSENVFVNMIDTTNIFVWIEYLYF